MKEKIRTSLRILLGLTLLFAGISHLTFARLEFQAQVPLWVPMDPDVVVVLSGFVEILFGIALLTIWKPRYAAYLGLVLGAFFIAVFPGNLSQYMRGIDAFGLNSDTARFARLFFQPVLVFWALWNTGATSLICRFIKAKGKD